MTADGGLLVPVRESPTLRNTVAAVVAAALEPEDTDRPAVHFIYPLATRLTAGEESREATRAEELLDRISVWAAEDLGEAAESVGVETALVGRYEYLFNPSDFADVFARYAAEHGLDRVVLDPEFNPTGRTPLLPSIRAELERRGVAVEVASVERPARRAMLVRRAGIGQFAILFGWAFGFYLLIGGSLSAFNLATGAISALIVAGILWRISLRWTVDVRQLAGRLARMALYVPFLLWEITKANVEIAYAVLHPELPIDPALVEFDAAVWAELPVATLANSITLTPGTLTVDVTREHFTVHTLTESSRADLLEGGLERAVRFVFFGRSAARIASPAERQRLRDLERDRPPTSGESE